MKMAGIAVYLLVGCSLLAYMRAQRGDAALAGAPPFGGEQLVVGLSWPLVALAAFMRSGAARNFLRAARKRRS